MLERLKKRIPLLLMTVFVTAWISYAYLDFIQTDITVFSITLWCLLAVSVVELIMTNRWTGIATGAVGYTHFLLTVFPIPYFSTLIEDVNLCLLDTFLKVFWTDRTPFVNENGSIFLLCFLIALSFYLLYVRVKSVALTVWLAGIYIFFMEFYKVAEVTMVVACAFWVLLALLFLYGYQWYDRAGTQERKRISLKYGLPVLSAILAIVLVFGAIAAPQPIQDFQHWLDGAFDGFGNLPGGQKEEMRFSNALFSTDGKIGGDISLSDTYRFSVISDGEVNSSLYLRGIAYDFFVDDAWKTEINHTAEDRLLESYFDENVYFCFDGNLAFLQANLEQEETLFRLNEVKVFYNETVSNVLFNHTYTTDLNVYRASVKDLYYDPSTYTYYNGRSVDSYSLTFLSLQRNLIGDKQFSSFSTYEGLSEQQRTQLETYYLQQPQEISQAVNSLARRVTAYDDSDYERAKSIEKYLKENYTYTLTPGDVPNDTNLVEYFLFGNKRGYCSYYASAMVMMCRSIGIPSRVVTGYRVDRLQPGELKEVTDRSCHAWVEVFIPVLGWVTFDPVSASDFSRNDPSAPSLPPAVTLKPTPKPTPTVQPTPTPSKEVDVTEQPGGTEQPTETITRVPVTDGHTPSMIPPATPSVTPAEPTRTPPISQQKQNFWWWGVLLLGMAIVAIAGLIVLLLRRKKKSTSFLEEQVPLNVGERLWNKLLRVYTFLETPMQTGETISQYLQRIQLPHLEEVLPVLEAYFYHHATMTYAQYKMLKEILQQEEAKAIAQKGKLKWFLYRIKHKV